MAKEYTEEQKAEIKRRRDERNAAVKALLTIVISKGVDGTIDEEVVALAKLAQPKASTKSGFGKVSVMARVASMFKETNEIDEVEIFTELHLGRSEMSMACKNLIKKSKPEDRLWISFDVEAGSYTLVADGAEAPEGWTGYVPIEEIVSNDSDVEPSFDDDDDDDDDDEDEDEA